MRRYFKFIKEMFTKNKIFVMKGLGIIFILTAMQAIIPLFMKIGLSEITARKQISILIIFVLGYGICLLLYNCIDVFWMKYLDCLGGKILEEIRCNIYRAISKGNYEELLRIGREKIKNILYMDTLNVYSSISCFGIQIVANVFLICVFLGVSIFVSWKLTIGLIAAAIIGFFISYISRKPIANASRKVNIKMKEDNQTLNEYIDSIELIKINHLDEYSLKKMKKSLWDFINTSLKSDSTLIFLKNIITQYHQVISFIIVAILSISMISSMADIVFCLYIVDLVLTTSQNIESYIYSLIKLLPAYENIDRILNIEDVSQKEKIATIEKIRMKNISFSYKGTMNQVISNMDFTFVKGDVVDVSGNNGSGKSTFVKLLTGLLYPTEGEILLNGIPSTQVDMDSLRDNILYISQDEIFLNDTIENYLEVITNQSISEEKLTEVKNKVNLIQDIEQITDEGLSMSGGQRKKILIMRLLLAYQKASIIILDELEAGLDIETRMILEEIKKEIISSKKDAIVFIISHEKEKDLQFTKYVKL
nr:ABC transporter ATP-binding protein [uncultured Faecalimonas sp.]